MTMSRFSAATSAALALLLSMACGPSPQSAPAPSQRNPRTQAELDSLRRNTVIENNRPDLPARAGMLVVANQLDASATVLNATTLQTIATVRVGTGPHEVAVSPDGRWAVVTNYGTRESEGNTLSVIDLGLAKPAVARTIDLGAYHRPHGSAFVAGGTKLLVTSETSQRLLVVDFASGRVDTALATNARGSHMLAVQRDGRRAWTANVADGTVTEFDVDRRTTGRTYPSTKSGEGIAATPGGTQVWVGSNTEHTVTVIETAKGEAIESIDGIGAAYRIGITRSGRYALVSDPTSNRLWVYEVASRKRVAELDLGAERTITPTGNIAAGPEGMAFDPIADFAYVSLHGTNQVAAVDLAQMRIAGVGAAGVGPDGIAYSPLVPR